MTVKELIEELQKLDQDRIVIMSKDSEGNTFSPLADCQTCGYLPTTTWYGETSLEELTPELKAAGFSEEDVNEDAQPAVCLWPTN